MLLLRHRDFIVIFIVIQRHPSRRGGVRNVAAAVALEFEVERGVSDRVLLNEDLPEDRRSAWNCYFWTLPRRLLKIFSLPLGLLRTQILLLFRAVFAPWGAKWLCANGFSFEAWENGRILCFDIFDLLVRTAAAHFKF